MAIEIRNMSPSNSAINVSPNVKIAFDIVAMDQFTIDITTLEVIIEMNSNIISGDISSVTYTDESEEVSFTGDTATFYHVEVSPSIPMDEGQNVTISINVQGKNDNDDSFTMSEYQVNFFTRYNSVISDFRYAFIDATERIPVYNELLRKDSTTDPIVFDSAFDKWNRDKSLKIRLNQMIIRDSDSTYGYRVDLDRGLVKFNSALDYNDAVDASYTFRFFKDEEIDAFFRMAVAQWTMAPAYGGPPSIYSGDRVTRGILMVGAAMFAYRELLMRLALQESRIIFDNNSWGEGWSKTESLFKGQYDIMKEMWNQSLEAKKLRLPQIGLVITSDVSLPGGRCLSYRNSIEIKGNKHENFDSVYNLVYEGKRVNVSTFDKNGNKIFAPILCVENEGKKDVFGVSVSFGAGINHEIKTIFTSSDHKYNTPSGMQRLKNLRAGSEVFIEIDNKKSIGKISDIGYLGQEVCFDIEVPKYHKFLCNGVNISNSRMFRYLYK